MHLILPQKSLLSLMVLFKFLKKSIVCFRIWDKTSRYIGVSIFSHISGHYDPLNHFLHSWLTSLPSLSADVSPGPTIWLFTWRGTSNRRVPSSTRRRSKGDILFSLLCTFFFFFSGEMGGWEEKIQTHAISRLVSWWEPSQRAEWRERGWEGEACSSQSMPFCTCTEITQCLRDLSFWKRGVWWVVCCNKRTKIANVEGGDIQSKTLNAEKDKKKKKTP